MAEIEVERQRLVRLGILTSGKNGHKRVKKQLTGCFGQNGTIDEE
jgi:hypothetical protein